jgi:hypothetical protein
MTRFCPKSALFLYVVCCLLSAPASGGFTKITEGDIVNDSGWSYGCAWADYNGDGFPDLFLDNNNPNHNKNNSLYLNNGDGTFTKITEGPVVTDDGSSYGCTWGDYDNSGLPDLFVPNYNENNFLYQNNGGGTFTKITQGRIVNDAGRSTGCAWADCDNDGLLDLFVCNRDQVNFLYHNEGNGTFARVAEGAIANDVDNSSGCAWGDYDDDGFPDLVVANVETPNCLYHNNGDGTFTKVTEGPVVTDTSRCNGASWGDLDNDGDLDLFVATGVLGTYNDLLYRNNGDGTFTKITDSPVVNDATWSGGGAWADFDNDGDLDLFVGGYDGHNRLYENDGTGVFTSIDTGVVVTDGNYIMGSAWADYDRDGDLDLFTARNNYFGGASCLYRNDGNAGHWLSVRCIGTVSNRMAIGARVRVKAAIGGRDVWQMREVSSQTGGCNSGQSSVNASFGLGDAGVVDSLVVGWPSGIVQVLTGVPANQFLTVTEQQAAVSEGPAQGRQAVLGFLSCPNPVQGRALVNYGMPKDGYVRLAFFDIQGRKLRTLVSTVEPVGVHVVVWDGADSDGRRLPGGTYFIRLDTDGGAVTRAVVVAR